ncbi:uncharacterized protein CTRU02_211128 [Colletotrichum truncatum]|uniref:Uncharacterized protein n=1 Tax=Colletotrichum truncatum TaxID=5467 RepID=A0ACC3YQY8_COLTU|nr:uncharacterized protein CTRU02_01909 [Colletotrichum truncatum]KAF6799038.1 hypothetical protein CTRU02_01909 [Colletotrichum truncatum]
MVDPVSGPADNVHFGSSPTFCGFTPINGRKRSLTPIAAIVNAVPTKRLASYASINSAGASGDDPSYRNTPNSSATVTADAKDVVSALHPSYTQTTPPLDDNLEIQSLETPQRLLLPLHNATELGYDDADLSWMDEFVNLDWGDDMSVIPPPKPPTNYPNADSIVSLTSPEERLSQNQSQAVRNVTPIVEDNYGFDDSDEEEMAQLGKPHTPSRALPTSEPQDMDRESRPSLS